MSLNQLDTATFWPALFNSFDFAVKHLTQLRHVQSPYPRHFHAVVLQLLLDLPVMEVWIINIFVAAERQPRLHPLLLLRHLDARCSQVWPKWISWRWLTGGHRCRSQLWLSNCRLWQWRRHSHSRCQRWLCHCRHRRRRSRRYSCKQKKL